MLTGIDHLVIAVDDPDAAAAELEASVGLRSTGGGRHETMGTHNRLVWLGDSYLELIGVWDERLAAASGIGRPALEALAVGRSFATFAVTSDALVDDLRRFRALGARWAGPIAGERTRSDGRVVRWDIGVPGPALGPDMPPFVIEHDATAAEWTPRERATRAEERHPIGGPARLEVLEIAVPDVRSVADRYLRAFGLAFRPSLAGGGARDLNVGAQIVRLRRGEGVPSVRLAVSGTDGRSVNALGICWIVRGM